MEQFRACNYTFLVEMINAVKYRTQRVITLDNRPSVPGELAQMVERPLSMREVPGSIPGFSNIWFLLLELFICFNAELLRILVCLLILLTMHKFVKQCKITLKGRIGGNTVSWRNSFRRLSRNAFYQVNNYLADCEAVADISSFHF